MARKKQHDDAPRITPGKAKNAVKVAKVVVPAVLPVVTPYALRAAAVLREGADRARARRLGVAAEDLSRFTGSGGALHARIAGSARGLRELAERPGANQVDVQFADSAKQKLDTLTTAVRAAETMPTTRRKTTHRAVASELDQLDSELLRRLNVR